MLFSNRKRERENEKEGKIMGARGREEYTIKKKKKERRNRFDCTKNIRCL